MRDTMGAGSAGAAVRSLCHVLLPVLIASALAACSSDNDNAPAAAAATRTATATATLAATDTPSPPPTATPMASGPFITTLAGTGVAGLNGDGLAPLKTNLYLPQDVTVGPDGNLYFADWNNHRIRRIRNGVVETVAGTGDLGDAQDGPALETSFNHPTNVEFDHQGRMIVAAWHNSVVKRVDFTTGLIENIAGTGARSYGGDDGPGNQAQLDLPSSVAIDAAGDIIISDQANYRIRMLDTSGIIHTIAGTGVAGYSGDGGPALAAQFDSPKGQAAAPAGRLTMDAQGRIYVADTANHCIRLIDADGIIRTIAGTGTAGYSGDGGPATAAQLNTPSDVAIAPDGTLYIADTMNNAIRMVSPNGIISTLAGTGQRGFSGDGDLAADAELDRPYGLDIGPDGTVYVADTHNQRIRRITATLPPDYNPTPGGEGGPVDIVPCSDQVGSICTYVGNGANGFNGDGLDRLQTALYWPFDIEFGASGRRYVLDWNNHKVREILTDDTVTTLIGTDFIGDGPADLSDLSDPGAPPLTVNLNHPTDVQELPDGDLALMAWHNHKIRVLRKTTGLVRVVAGGPPGFSGDDGPAISALLNQPPHGALDAHGNLFFIDQRNQRIRVIYDFADKQGDGIIKTVVGTGVAGFNGDGPALETQVDFPAGSNPEPSGGIAVDANGALYFSDTFNHRIRRVDFTSADFTQGTVTTIAGTGVPGYNGDGGPAVEAQVNQPEDLEVGPDGNVYFADANNNRVRMIDLSTGKIETVAGTGTYGYSGDGGAATDAELGRPFGVAFDKYGDLYIADTFNGRIRKVNRGGGPQAVFPADYRSSYTLVRDCRFSAAHGGVYIRVWANPIAAQPYLENANPLPVGSILVKEEFAGSDCSDDNQLIGWRVMRKEAPGFDPVDNDWHWQKVSAHRGVIFDTKDTCIGCHRVPDCLGRDYMCTLNDVSTTPTPATSPTPTPVLSQWPIAPVHKVMEGLPAALLSITGTSSSDVYAVGADPQDGKGPYVLHYDGSVWRRLQTGATGNLWWISVTPIDGAFYMAGENGLILRYDPATAAFSKQDTPGNELMFGIWGSDEQHIWAVGGDPNDPDHGGVVWFFDGETWVPDDDVGRVLPGGIPTLYKVWGRSTDDVYAVGRLGLVLHWDGIRWAQVSVAASGATLEDLPLFTVHGNADEVIATGGFFDGVIFELMNSVFQNRAVPGTPQMNGVFLRPDGTGVSVGVGGAVAFRNGNGWQLQRPGVDTAHDFHGTWVDPDGGVWAVGGELNVDLNQGLIGYGGPAAISSIIAPGPYCPPGFDNGPATVSYVDDIVPLFTRSGCLDLSCHGGTFPASGYDLGDYRASFGPASEAASLDVCNIAPGSPDNSFLMEKITTALPRMGVRMPNGRPPLSSADIDLIRSWILEGARNDAPVTPTPTPTVAPTPQPTHTPASCSDDGIICTVAGTGKSQFDGDGRQALDTSFYFPFQVIFDATGRPLILDFNNLRVRRMDADGTIETIMGKDFEGAPENGALAIDTPLHHPSDIEFDSGGNLYVAGDHVAYVFRVGTDNRVQILAGTGDNGSAGDGGPALQATLTTPFGVLPTNDGGFYISDVDANVIRYVDASGIITTVAGNGTRGYGGDGGPATAAQLHSPTRMRLDASGNLYFCDTNNHAIRRIDRSGVITTIAGDGTAGYSGDNGPAAAAGFNTPYDLQFAPNGDLYVADTGNNVIRRIDASGVVTTVVGTGDRGFVGDADQARSCQLNRPSALTFAADGSLWISDTFNQRVRRVAGFLGLHP